MAQLGDFWVFLVLVFGWGGEGVVGQFLGDERVVVVGRSVFEFNNLMSGDVVKIYNINGKKIKEITSGDAGGFEWDGKKDDGTWAESGAYIYQIKIEGKSKLISGTIAFVR